MKLWFLRLFVRLASDPLQLILVITFAKDELVGVVRKAILDTELDLYLLLLKSGGIGWLLLSRGRVKNNPISVLRILSVREKERDRVRQIDKETE